MTKDIVRKVSIIGVGTQGSMIAFRNAIHGKYVVGFSRTQKSRDTAINKIRKWLDYYIEVGRLSKEEAECSLDRIRMVDTIEEAVKDSDLVVENIPEILESKKELFEQLDKICDEKTYFNTNTSSLLMSEFIENISDERKKKCFAVDHDDPIRNDYLEMMWNKYTSEKTKEVAIGHYNTLGFDPIITEKEIKGYSINRVWRAVKRECLYLWAKGYVKPSEFDRGWMIEWDTDMGPFKLMDLIGLDTIYNIEMSYYNASGEERDKPPIEFKEMVESGKLGMKSGEGFYNWKDTEAGNLMKE